MNKSTIVSLIAGVAVGVAATKVAEKYNLVEKVSSKFSNKKDDAGICQNVLNSAATVAAEEKPENKEEFSPVK